MKDLLSKFGLREREKFSYEYDFNCSWKHQIRVETILPNDNELALPVCTVGKGNCPPENCGGGIEFIRLRQQHSRFKLAARFAEIILKEGIEKIGNHISLFCHFPKNELQLEKLVIVRR